MSLGSGSSGRGSGRDCERDGLDGDNGGTSGESC
jgi:hypothetical protein